MEYLKRSQSMKPAKYYQWSSILHDTKCSVGNVLYTVCSFKTTDLLVDHQKLFKLTNICFNQDTKEKHLKHVLSIQKHNHRFAIT